MAEFKHLSVAELPSMRAQQAVQIVDIRDEYAFTSGHIPGAQRLDNRSLPDFLKSADPDMPLVVCCYHGQSSQNAAAFLNDQGFATVYSLDGGFTQWQMTYPDDIERD